MCRPWFDMATPYARPYNLIVESHFILQPTHPPSTNFTFTYLPTIYRYSTSCSEAFSAIGLLPPSIQGSVMVQSELFSTQSKLLTM